MNNDVNPLSMTLEEIYGLPESDFEVIHKLDQGDFRYDVYGGRRHRSNGTVFFTVKTDDPYGIRGKTCKCYLCTEIPEVTVAMFWGLYSKLGDPDMTRRAHP
jgi:hypothetical protein